jgi:hypothetical protein
MSKPFRQSSIVMRIEMPRSSQDRFMRDDASSIVAEVAIVGART